jgi:phospholipid/cholesterol/gamma-HCH transport system substrate-binding protein
MKFSKYTKLGLLIVASVAILIWGLSYLKGHDFFKRNAYYHVVYDRVDGLVVSDAVTLNGYQVGQVKSINFIDNGTGNLCVTISVDSKFRIPYNSVARIISSDIMGTKSIKLVYNPNEKVYQNNDTIPGAIESDLVEQVSMQVLPLKSKAEQLLASFDSAITILTVIFNEDARENLSESFRNINQTIANIEQTSLNLKNLISEESGAVKQIVENIDTVTNSFKNKTGEIQKIISNLSAFSDSLSTISVSPLVLSIGQATKQLDQILTKLNSSESSAGKLLNDDELYTNLNLLTNDLNKLLRDIRLNPKRYLNFSAFDFGKEVYFTSSGQNNKDILYRINLISTTERISLDSGLFNGLGQVEEYPSSGAYSYLLGSTSDFGQIQTLWEQATNRFPDAKIVAFKNGKLIKIERALKKNP